MGLQRTNVMLDGELWKSAMSYGEGIERSGSWVLNKALEAYLQKNDKKKKPASKKEVAVIDESDVIIRLPLNSGFHFVTSEDVIKYVGLYPKINIGDELRAMYGWLDANPSSRKTKAGIARFINTWLKRAQDKGGSNLSSPVKLSPSERFNQRHK